MNEYGALVENGSWGKAEAFGENPIEYTVHHKFHVDCPWI